MECRKITCANCGKKTIDRTSNGRGRFCSKKCASVYSNRRRGLAKNKDMRCLFNDYVVCGVHNCRSCGWNPTEEEKRKEALA